ncbi:hypothetical protein L2E82_01476 [Cichorium intybus]|uniref:Uncharacterized protein n=1 Tax=Cichorium intybus TaxID=13427 RepID=A0ACB9H037_CICIN|nr:hypothetical protein L2E82_01476 [Cichorium intybus]
MEEVQGFEKDSNLNAFDIISFSRGCNLSGFFNHNAEDEREVSFMSRHTFDAIILKLEEMAKSWKLQVLKRNVVLLRIEGLEKGINDVLAIYFEIYEIMPDLHLIEVKGLGGDKFRFLEIVNEHIRPALMSVV